MLAKAIYAVLLFFSAVAPSGCQADRVATRPRQATAVCDRHFTSAIEPAVEAWPAAKRLTRVCYTAFAAAVSGVTGTPIWVAERLTRENVRAARQLDRTGEFFEDGNVPSADRASLDDYRGSGFDRGHMAPSGDMPTQAAQQESFSLANIVPQDEVLNRYLWAKVESAVRDLAVREGVVFVVTGPIFDRASGEERGAGRVRVPSGVFKAVLVPGKGAAAYVAENDDTPELRYVSLGQLQDLAGVDAFPSASRGTKVHRLWLPKIVDARTGTGL